MPSTAAVAMAEVRLENARNGYGNETARETNVSTDADDHDDCANGEIAWIQHADLILLHQCDALHADHTKKIDS